jgi:uncharacterized membrane protein YedE/YeeE
MEFWVEEELSVERTIGEQHRDARPWRPSKGVGPLRTVIDALSIYSLGYSLEDTVARVKSKTGRTIGASTIAGWLAQHKPLMSYLRLRDKGRHLVPAEQTIRAIKLYHRQIYRYAFHRPKLEFLRHGELDDKHPILAAQCTWPTRTGIDRPLVIGAVLFGIGWGLVGLCPGPALENLATLSPRVVVFVAAMAFGIVLHRIWEKRHTGPEQRQAPGAVAADG